MRINLLIILLSFQYFVCYSQRDFDKGYYITNQGVKTECYIKNNDNQQNPFSITYRNLNEADKLILNITDIKEFGIYGYSRYIRSQIKIDTSPVNYTELNSTRNPVWKDSLVFLKTLINGKAKLYSFTNEFKTYYFFSTNDSVIEQLIYKDFKKDNFVITNYGFRQQLLLQLKHEKITEKLINNLTYTDTDLKKVFMLYNDDLTQNDSIFIQKREIFNLRISSGIDIFKLNVRNLINENKNANFQLNPGMQFGLETEFFIPFKKNKIGLLFDPNFQYIHQNTTEKHYEQITFKYSIIDFPIGIRYYYFLNNTNAFFLNAHYISNICMNFNSKLIYFNQNPLYNQYPNTELEIIPSPHFSFGIGYKFKQSSIEIRINSKRNVFTQYINNYSDFKKISFVYSYKLMKVSK